MTFINSLKQKQLKLAKTVDNNDSSYQSYHDIKNCLFAIAGYIELGEYVKARRKIDFICKSLDICDPVNPILHAFIYHKMDLAKSSNINFQILNSDVPPIDINACDLCAAIGNALDNAIEACRKIADETKRYIKMTMFVKRQYLNIIITNPTSKMVKIKYNNIITTKKEKHAHGFGLQNIQIIAKKHHGQVILYRGIRKFSIKIKLRMK